MSTTRMLAAADDTAAIRSLALLRAEESCKSKIDTEVNESMRWTFWAAAASPMRTCGIDASVARSCCPRTVASSARVCSRACASTIICVFEAPKSSPACPV